MSKPHPHFNPGPAQLGLSGGTGKGDADRSPGWRENYDDIDWGVVDPFLNDGAVTQKGPKHFIKKYGKVTNNEPAN